jgi:hypothetical protein
MSTLRTAAPAPAQRAQRTVASPLMAPETGSGAISSGSRRGHGRHGSGGETSDSHSPAVWSTSSTCQRLRLGTCSRSSLARIVGRRAARRWMVGSIEGGSPGEHPDLDNGVTAGSKEIAHVAHRRQGAGVRLHPSSAPRRPHLALDGAEVGALIGVDAGVDVGDALRWLEAQVAENPQLNTPQALSALLEFAPTSAWQPARRRSGHRRHGRAHRSTIASKPRPGSGRPRRARATPRGSAAPEAIQKSAAAEMFTAAVEEVEA